MIKISVWDRDVAESYLRQVTRLDVCCVDFGQ